MAAVLPAQALPTLLTSRPRPLLDCKVPCDAGSPAKGQHALQEAYPSAFRVRNTFIDTSAQRSPSLEAVFRERDVSTCPASHAGRLRGLFGEASTAHEVDDEVLVRHVQSGPFRSSQAFEAGDATPDGADEPRLHPYLAPVAILRLAEMLDRPVPHAALSTLQSPTNVGLPAGCCEMQHELAWNSPWTCCNTEMAKVLPQTDAPSAHGMLGSWVLDESGIFPGTELGRTWSQVCVASSGADAVGHGHMAGGFQQPMLPPAGSDVTFPLAAPSQPDLLCEAQQERSLGSLQGLAVGPALRMPVDPGCSVVQLPQRGGGSSSDASPCSMLVAAGHAVPLAPGLVTTPSAPPSQPAPGSPELPSVGSAGHASGQCKPCAFVHSTGCQHGPACQFCHLCEPGEKKRRRKEKLERLRAARKLRNATE